MASAAEYPTPWQQDSNALTFLMKTRSKSYRLVRRAGQQGTRPLGRNQRGIEKCAAGINSSEDDVPGNQNQDIPNPEPVVIPPNKPPKAKRTRWTKEEYKTVLRECYTAQKTLLLIWQNRLL